MTQAIDLTERIKYVTDTDTDGAVGVMILLGESEDSTVVKEVTSKREFTRIYKSFRNVEVLDNMTK